VLKHVKLFQIPEQAKVDISYLIYFISCSELACVRDSGSSKRVPPRKARRQFG
jgi:hypothetical protein